MLPICWRLLREQKQIPQARFVVQRHIQIAAGDAGVAMRSSVSNLSQRPSADQRVADKRVAPVVDGQSLEPDGTEHLARCAKPLPERGGRKACRRDRGSATPRTARRIPRRCEGSLPTDLVKTSVDPTDAPITALTSFQTALSSDQIQSVRLHRIGKSRQRFRMRLLAGLELYGSTASRGSDVRKAQTATTGWCYSFISQGPLVKIAERKSSASSLILVNVSFLSASFHL
jgi:hypothetical protein